MKKVMKVLGMHEARYVVKSLPIAGCPEKTVYWVGSTMTRYGHHEELSEKEAGILYHNAYHTSSGAKQSIDKVFRKHPGGNNYDYEVVTLEQMIEEVYDREVTEK